MCYIDIKGHSNADPQANFEQMKSHQKKYIAWMYHQFERHDRGELLHTKSDWNKIAEDDRFVAELERRLETASAGATLSIAFGKVLPQIHSGEIDPHQISSTISWPKTSIAMGLGRRSAMQSWPGILTHWHTKFRTLRYSRSAPAPEEPRVLSSRL